MLRQKQTITKNSGFTLVEAIVTMIIMLTLMGIILTGLIQAKQRFLVRDSAQQFANFIRQTIADTKNGIKVKNPACDANVNVPRECSNYKISSILNGTSHTAYKKYVIGSSLEYADPSNQPLQAGTGFSGQLTLNFDYSSGSFPLVSTTLAGTGIVYGTGTIQITIKSLSNENIKTNICILKAGSVLVQAEDCG